MPTGTEWEKAARGTDGRTYPWGSSGFGGDGMVAVANICDKNCEDGLTTYDDGWAKTAPVGSFAAGSSPYGAVDMVGNVAEYVDGLRRVMAGTEIVELRGTNWHDGVADTKPSSRRGVAISLRSVGNGFRCAKGTAADTDEATLAKSFSLRIGTKITLPGARQNVELVTIEGEGQSTFQSGRNIAIFVQLGADYKGRTAELRVKDLTDDELDEASPIEVSSGGGTAVTFNLRLNAEHPRKVRITLTLDEMRREQIITIVPAR